MGKWKNILKEQKGEGYIDTAVLVLCAMLVIAIAVRVYPVYITKLQLDNFADELIREMEIAGSVGAETSERERELQEKTGLSPHKRELKQEVYKFPISKKLKKFTITTLFRVK